MQCNKEAMTISRYFVLISCLLINLLASVIIELIEPAVQ